ncbi:MULTISPECIES: hypothetical protein [unclassified Thalassospira]|uniref:hypothetical protein n=1 Tax=unclassified Thalassospira TaxID=2648997 RepID=UPI001B1B1687|nr:hypothetical protein [Thalassospira sp.]MBO6769758.1 hypothetical protein [Thalassospira sp.]
MKIENVLTEILGLINQESFGGRAAPVVSISDETTTDENGNLRGELEVKIARRDGEMVLLHQKSLHGISSESELKDMLADVLSKVLASHSKWPR